MVFEGLGLANYSNLGGAALRSAAVTAHRVAVVDHRMHGDEAGEQDAERADNVAAYGFGHCSSPAGNAELEHGIADALLDAAFADADVPGDFLRRESLGNVKKALQFARR